MTDKKIVYVAGPFRSLKEPYDCWEQEQNIRRAEEVALNIWLQGQVAICPHTLTRFYQGAAPDQTWIDGDLEILRRCDAMLVLPGWESSMGTKIEIEFAKKNNIPTFHRLSMLMTFLASSASDANKV